jgi:hypothetical protein
LRWTTRRTTRLGNADEELEDDDDDEGVGDGTAVTVDVALPEALPVLVADAVGE